MNFAHCLHIVWLLGSIQAISEAIFSGEVGGLGGRVTWEDLSMEEFSMLQENFS